MPRSVPDPDSWTHHRARIAALKRAGARPNDPDLIDAQRRLRETRLADYIDRVLTEAPPLTAEQRTRLAELLRPVRINGGDLNATA